MNAAPLHDDSGGVSLSTPDFINGDAGRFQIFLDDKRRTEETLDVMLKQAGSLTDSRAVTLHRQAGGTYLSTNLLLVADAEDRDNTALTAAGAPPGINQRMFRTELEDTLSVSYTHNGVTLTNAAAVGKDVKTLHVDVAVMTINGVRCATQNEVENDMQAMQERYAQANIKVNWTPKTFPAPPAIINAGYTNWAVYTHNPADTSKFLLTDTAKDVVNAANLNSSHMRVIYLPTVKTGTLQSGILWDVIGYAVTGDVFNHSNDKDYVGNTCFVTVSEHSNYIPAHEVGHLLGLGHDPNRWNLMFGAFPTPPDPVGKDPRANKRLTQEQVNTMRQDTHLQ